LRWRKPDDKLSLAPLFPHSYIDPKTGKRAVGLAVWVFLLR
jgi:hypothetical protein